MILFALVGVGALTLPAHDDDGAARTRLAGVRAAVAAAPASSATRPAAAAPAPTGAKPGSNELISATFAQLPIQPGATQVASAASKPADPAPDESLAPTRHVVQTTVIHATTPGEAVASLAPVTAAPAATHPVPLAPAPDATAAVPAASPPEPPIEAAPAQVASAPVPMPPPVAAKPDKASGPRMKVGGSGVSVRSGPSKTHGVLFNLAAGQKVTVTSKQRGWLQITDSTGRHGWAYSNLFSKL